jgi:hypothetical protein
VKPAFSEQVQKYGCFRNFHPAETASYLVSGEVLVIEGVPASVCFICFHPVIGSGS